MFKDRLHCFFTPKRCGNCAAFEPLRQGVLEKYKDDPRVHKEDGTCAKGPFLRYPLVHPKDKCDPTKLIDGFVAWASGTLPFDPKKSQWEPIKK